MNKEKIKWLNFLLKFRSINIDKLKGRELSELATELDDFIHNDTVSNSETTIKNLVILDDGDGMVDDYTDTSIRDLIIYEIAEIQNEFKSDAEPVLELLEKTRSESANYKLEKKFSSHHILSIKNDKFCLTDGYGESIKEILANKFTKCINDVPFNYFYKCPECEAWFVNQTKRIKTYCTNKCSTRFLMRKKRKEEKLAKSGKYREELEEGSKRARKSYVKKVQKGNPKIKVVSRPIKYKRED